MTSELPQDTIDLTFERVHCSRHGEPLRSQWPTGYAVMMIKLFEAVFRDQATLADNKRDEDDRTDPEKMHDLLDDTPMCCRVSDAKLLEIYTDAGFGVVAKCKVCRRKRIGSSYTTSIKTFTHLCFECVTHRMKPLQ